MGHEYGETETVRGLMDRTEAMIQELQTEAIAFARLRARDPATPGRAARRAKSGLIERTEALDEPTPTEVDLMEAAKEAATLEEPTRDEMEQTAERTSRQGP